MHRVTSPIKNKKVIVQKADLKGLLSYGRNNLYPQDLELLLSDSVTGTACRQIKADFIQGNGFKDPDLAQMVIHPKSGMTMDSALEIVADNASFLEAIPIHVGYNGEGKISSLMPIIGKKVRLAEPNDNGILTHGAICPFLGSTYNQKKRKQFTELPLFNPNPDVVLAQMAQVGGINNYHGQLLYVQLGPQGDDYYSQPSWVAGGRSVESEGLLDQYHWRIITSGFNISGILKVVSPQVTDGAEYDPYLDPFSIENQIAGHQGSENAASILIQRFGTIEDMNGTQFIDTTGANLAERYNATSARVEGLITRAWRVPNELVGIRRAGGIAPTGDEVRVASQLMQQTVNRTQRRIEQLFTMLFSYWKDPVVPKLGFGLENLNYFPDGAATNTVAQPG